MRFIKASLFFIFLLFTFSFSNAQLLEPKDEFTHADTLRGSNGPGRNWWDVLKYDIHVKFNLEDSTISGWNEIEFKVTDASIPITSVHGNLTRSMQIDLQDPLILDSVLVHHAGLENIITKQKFSKEGNAYFINLIGCKLLTKIKNPVIKIYYHGKPTIALRPPWDGGVIWKRDKNKNPFISIACEGLGASVWYPCKDIQSDEPDSAEMHITIPENLECVGNGRFRGKTNNIDGTATYNWAVTSPINNYNIIPYIGKYAHFSEVYKGEAGDLDMDYWVLDYNLEKAKEHFKDAPKMMQAFEYWFGPYPFYADGYKLVEAPHLGMEHQSAIAYGNAYKKGYLGMDRSTSGFGSKFDYIIVHESGHEWFGNNITSKDAADMWVHESFTSYSETLFTEYYYGKEAADQYVRGWRREISNDKLIIGIYGVNKEGSGDMYSKGANMIHTIRQVINDDSLFRQILRGLNKTFYHQTVNGKDVEDYISRESKIDFSKVFDQYLRTTDIPTLEYKLSGNKLQYRYTTCIKGFNLPLKIYFKGAKWINPAENWQTLIEEGAAGFSVDPNFYINTKKVD
ncbi:MAG: M1 family metallopeptidase [Bacteroidota bacterium]